MTPWPAILARLPENPSAKGDMLQITFSNRLEPLLERLLASLEATPRSVFATDQVIIPSAAMRRKVDLAITDRFGICANVKFSFLGQWIWERIGALLPVDRNAHLTPAVLAWRIFTIFGDATFTDAYPRLRSYLAAADPVMRFDLATRTAVLLEQYNTYRPDWTEQWGQGTVVPLPEASAAHVQDQAWQAALWQRILKDIGARQQHLAPAILRQLKAAIQAGPVADAGMPIHIVCLPAIAPAYLEALRELGSTATIHLYVLNACREYWFDIVDRKRLSYLALQGDTQHHELGNRLLGAWGKQSQAQIDLLLETDAHAVIDDACFVIAEGTSLLAHLHNAVLDLAELAPASIVLAPDDRSIEIHSCHSLTRELEVLQDRLLALFAGPTPPLPGDILVVTPDLEEAAALIDTVFGSVPFNRRIPYTITGRAASHANPAAQALLGLLALASGRITASAVFERLQQPIVGRRFGFDADELDLVHSWLGPSGIRWGLGKSADSVANCSFEDGLHRLFLGYALPGAIAQPFVGRIPAVGIEGSEAEILGRFWLAVQMIGDLQAELARPRPAADWLPLLERLLDTFLDPDNDELDDLQEVRATVRSLHEQFRHAGAADAAGGVPADVMRTALTALLDESMRGGVPAGSVTFAGMSSLRNLPYAVVCMIGVNDGAFPSLDRPTEFDLMTSAPRRGDRQRRSDDRNLFLDLILAARKRLYISYTGRGIRDNAPLPPSVLVADLLDYLAPAIATDTGNAALAAARARLVLSHPLQPFSMRYFLAGGDPRLGSANTEYCAALQHALGLPPPGTDSAVIEDEQDLRAAAGTSDDADVDDDTESTASAVQPFFTGLLPAPGPEWRAVTADQLKKFFSNPSRYLLRYRMDLSLSSDDDTLQDDEPFLADFTGRADLAKRLLPLFAQGAPLSEITAMARAGIELPPGPMGDKALAVALSTMQSFSEKLSAACEPPCLPPEPVNLSIDIDGEAWHLSGAFADLRPTGLVRSRYDETRATDYLSGWIDHLLLNVAPPAGISRSTLWISRDGHFKFNECDEAALHLGVLMRLYRQGISAPLHFYPKSAWQYAMYENDLWRANKTWITTRYNKFGEDRDSAYRLALRGVADPLDDAFEEAAQAVFGPLLEHLEDNRL
jgi:exodeoxyribonuclease V gamma subunit